MSSTASVVRDRGFFLFIALLKINMSPLPTNVQNFPYWLQA